MNDVATHVTEDLELDVMRGFDELFDVNAGVTESLFGFTARCVITLYQRNIVVRHAHTTTATASDGFNHHRVANAFRNSERFLLVLDGPVGTGRRWHTGTFGKCAAGRFVLERIHRARTRPDETDIATFANVREVRVLRKKTVTGMDRINIGDFRRADDTVDAEVTFVAWRFADADGFVRHLDMDGINVSLRINRNGPDIQFLAGANDAHCDFASVGNQDFFEHLS